MAEPTRLRILRLCADGELAVSEITQIVGQSQPRVSRHLKILADTGLIEPMREGNWTFYRLERDAGGVVESVLANTDPADDVFQADQEQLDLVREKRRRNAQSYFDVHASHWDEIRALHVDPDQVEQALLAQVPRGEFGVHLDIGTGTGRILTLLAPRVRQSVGIDNSRAMLAIARDAAISAGYRGVSLRLADMYNLPMPAGSVDLVTIHLVLHYADAPERAIAEAARVLRPGGRLIIIDFAPHQIEELRAKHAHRRLGFTEDEVRLWLSDHGLGACRATNLEGGILTVTIWTGDAAEAQRARPRRATGSPWI